MKSRRRLSSGTRQALASQLNIECACLYVGVALRLVRFGGGLLGSASSAAVSSAAAGRSRLFLRLAFGSFRATAVPPAASIFPARRRNRAR